MLVVNLAFHSTDIFPALQDLFPKLIDAALESRYMNFLLLDRLGELVVALVRVHLHREIQGLAGRNGHAELQVTADDTFRLARLLHGSVLMALGDFEVGQRAFES